MGITPLVQSQIEEEEKEETIQAKEVSRQGPEITPKLSSHVNAMRGSWQQLPESVQQRPVVGGDLCEERGPATREEPLPLIYNYKKARQLGASEQQRSKRPAVGYAQILLNKFLSKHDNWKFGTGDKNMTCTGDEKQIGNLRKSLPLQIQVDCWFGDETERATRMFQLCDGGLKVDGKIGERTWPVLESVTITPATSEKPPPAFAEDGDQVCPTDYEILLAPEAQQSYRTSALVEDRQMAVAPKKVGASSGHVSIIEAVERFKQKVNVINVSIDENVSRKGQFFWKKQVSSAIEKKLNQMFSEPSARNFVQRARIARAIIYSGGRAEEPLQDLDREAKNSSSSEKHNMMAILSIYPEEGGAALESKLWAELGSKDEIILEHHSSLRKLRALTKRAYIGCGAHAVHVARRLKLKGGITARAHDASSKKFYRLLANSAVRDRRPVPPHSHYHLGDVLEQKGVNLAMKKMQDALDAGLLIYARVLSGVGYGTHPYVPPEPNAKPFPLGKPPIEHWLLIIGYDSNQFVFNDPDAAVSHTPERGFGLLFCGDGQLSTAHDSNDYLVDPGGKHRRDDKRYQVIELNSTE
jgi:hypothetical protein